MSDSVSKNLGKVIQIDEEHIHALKRGVLNTSTFTVYPSLKETIIFRKAKIDI